MLKILEVLLNLPRLVGHLLLLLYLCVAVVVRAAWWRLRLIGATPSERNPADPYFDVICFSHVPWSHIWQRNHHTITRLTRNRKVIYFQTVGIAYIHWFVKLLPGSLNELQNSSPQVDLVYPLLLPGQGRIPGIAVINRWIMNTHVRWLEHEHGLRNTVLWFYYPAVAHVLESIKPLAVIYDIQDEYTAFDWSPSDIAQRERYLLDHADIIFAGTHALYERKTKDFQGKAWFYPCAVEFGHFFSAAPAFDDAYFADHPEIPESAVAIIRSIHQEFKSSGAQLGTVSSQEVVKPAATGAIATVSDCYRNGNSEGGQLREPPGLRDLGRPRLLYVGLIDKRIDPDLLAHLGQAHPDWEIVMIGPVDEKLFNQQSVELAAPNVRFMGSRKYQQLPNYLANCDLYLMPWKVNDLTRHINPTKTLEYMAAGRPVVSINLPDLENLFSDSVCLATTSESFVAECEAALAGQRWDKVARGLERSWSFAWEAVVPEMEQHIREVIASKHNLPHR